MEKINGYASKYGYSIEKSCDEYGANTAQYTIEKDDARQDGLPDGEGMESRGYSPSINKYARDLREILMGKLSGTRICRYSLEVAYGDERFTLEHKYSGIPCLAENASELAANLAAASIKQGGAYLPASGLDAECEITLGDGRASREITCADLASACEVAGTELEFVDPGSHVATLVRPKGCASVALSLSFAVEEGSGALDAGDASEPSGGGRRAGRNKPDEKACVPTGARYQPLVRCAVIPSDDGSVKMEIETDGSRSPDDALLEAALRLAAPYTYLDEFKEEATL